MAFEAMKDAAQRLGWKLTPENPGMLDIYSVVTITGVDSGVPVLLDRRAATYGFATIGFIDPPLPVPFMITTEGVGGTIANALGMHDIEIGDAAFDKQFRITSKDPDFMKRLLTPEMKALIAKLHALTEPVFNGFKVTEGAISVERSYVTNMITPEDIVADIPHVVAAVRTLEETPALVQASAGGYR